MSKRIFLEQILPLALTAIIATAMSFLLVGEIHILNLFSTVPILTHIRFSDVLIGATIYLKTSIDFAIFMGSLMQKHPGWKNRISIEIGTAMGNAIGTMAILLVWTFFREIEWLLAIMILVAALVLITLAEDSLEHAKHADAEYPKPFRKVVTIFGKFLQYANVVTRPLVSYILPKVSVDENKGAKGFWSLLAFAFVIPFVLGLDDFAGYVPLFSVVNILGFSVGVFFAHALLNALLYLSPSRTIRAVKNPVIALIGSAAFVGLAGLGIYEAIKLLFV